MPRVVIRNQAYEVTRMLGSGAEGEVFSLTTSECVKLLNEDLRTEDAFVKITRLADALAGAPTTSVAYPTAHAYEETGPEERLWAGFVMPKVQGAVEIKNLRYDVSTGRLGDVTDSSGLVFSDAEAVALCIESFAILECLHARRIVLGDLNDGNLLLTSSPLRITFVDVDSFQLEGEACLVKTEDFLDPYIETRSKTLNGRFHFSPQSDIYALAFIWFTALFNAGPYSGTCEPREGLLSRKLKGLTCLRDWRQRRNAPNQATHRLDDGAGMLPRAEQLAQTCPELMEFFVDTFVHGRRRALIHYFKAGSGWRSAIDETVSKFTITPPRRIDEVSADSPGSSPSELSDPTILRHYLGQYGLNLQD